MAGSTITRVPPGLSTLSTSDRPARLSYQSLNENSEHTASNEPSSKGNSSAVPSTNSTTESPLAALFGPTRISATLSISGIGSRHTRSLPTTSSAKLPGPHPTSSMRPVGGSLSITIPRHLETCPKVANLLILSYTGMLSSRLRWSSPHSSAPMRSVSIRTPPSLLYLVESRDRPRSLRRGDTVNMINSSTVRRSPEG